MSERQRKSSRRHGRPTHRGSHRDGGSAADDRTRARKPASGLCSTWIAGAAALALRDARRPRDDARRELRARWSPAGVALPRRRHRPSVSLARGRRTASAGRTYERLRIAVIDEKRRPTMHQGHAISDGGTDCAELCLEGCRNRYFRRKQMTAEDFKVEQAYMIERRRLMNRALYGWG